MPRRPSKDELKGIVQKMIDANESEENIATVIKRAQESPDVFEMLTSPLVPQIADAAHAIADHIDAPKLNRSENEAYYYGLVAGVTGAAGDLVAGFTSPIGIAMTLAGLGPESRVAEAVPALKGLLKIPAIKTLQSAVQGGSSAGFAAKGAYDAVTAPTTEGKLLGAAQAASGAAGFGLGAPEATLSSTRAVGRAFVEAGNHPGAIRMGVGGFMGGAAAAGHLDAAATALPALLVPQVLKKTGQGIIRLGTPVIDRPPVPSTMLDRFRPNVSSASDATPVVADRVPIMGDVPSEAGKSGIGIDRTKARLEDQFDNAMARRNVSFADEQTATRTAVEKTAAAQKANADRLATIQDAAAGRTEGVPSISRSISADTADGGRTSMSIRMQPPEGAKGGGIGMLSAEEVAGLRKQGFADDIITKIATGNGTVVHPPAPKVTPTGQAAADLANVPAGKARPPYNQQAAAENIANGSSYNNGHVIQDPKPTELSDLATEGPDTGMVYDAEHGVAVPKDLSFEAGHPDVPGLTVGKAGTNPLSNRPAPKGSIRVGKGPLDDILGPEGPKGAFDWPEAGGRFEPDATGSHVLKSSRTPASNFGEFMNQLDEAMGGAKSKSKKGSGQWKNLSDNDATTAANAYSTGVRNPEEVIQAILDKRKARQSIHIESHYANQQQIPE